MNQQISEIRHQLVQRSDPWRSQTRQALQLSQLVDSSTGRESHRQHSDLPQVLETGKPRWLEFTKTEYQRGERWAEKSGDGKRSPQVFSWVLISIKMWEIAWARGTPKRSRNNNPQIYTELRLDRVPKYQRKRSHNSRGPGLRKWTLDSRPLWSHLRKLKSKPQKN